MRKGTFTPSLSHSVQPDHKRSGGVALLIVLGMLVILSVIVIAFMSRVTTDLADSKGYQSQTNVRMLADSAVNLVIAQIRQASTASNNAWISQPGLIRTYDTSGNPVTAYKLYSSSQMTVTGAFDPSAGADLPAGNTWLSQPNLYTDLNSPVTSGTNLPVFPIIDGNAMQTITQDGTTTLSYSTDGINPDIQGFGTNPAAVGISYTPGNTPTAATNPVPMPVQWLYMLKDGTLLTATAGSGANVTIGSGTTIPTASNPIVARVAFWTDDETSKVNINTASEGTFWDTPVCDTQPSPTYSSGANVDVNRVYEWDLGMYQGSQNEFQRYPGHPATTCLSPVLGVWIRNALGIPLSGSMTTSQRQNFVSAISTIAPRIVESSTSTSMGGTQRAPAVATPDTDRLYATADELLYMPSRTIQSTISGSTILTSGSDPRPLVEKTKFFLTASSKAPEQNLFNMPRIAIWPITKAQINSGTDTSRMTTNDQLVAFCSTVGGTSTNLLPFYFTRQDPTSSTTDWGTRNAALYSYLQTLTGQSIPGFGGNFSSKYGADRNQILTEIFDYIRCTNLVDITASTGGAYTGPAGSGSTASGQVAPINPGNGTRGAGRIATIPELSLLIVKTDSRINSKDAEDTAETTNVISGGTYTYTDTPHPNWKNIVEPNKATLNGVNYTGPTLIGGSLNYNPATQTQIQCALVPRLYSPMAGFPALYNDISIKFHQEIGTIKITDQSGTSQAVFSGSAVTMSGTGGPFLNPSSDNECKIGGDIGVMTLMVNNPTATPPTSGTFTVNGTSILSATSTSQTPGSPLVITSGTFAVDIYAPDINKNGSIVQTLNFQFSGTVPIPKLALNQTQTLLMSGTVITGTTYTYTAQPYYPLPGASNTNTRFDSNLSNPMNVTKMIWSNNYWVPGGGNANTGDTVRSLVATGSSIQGDFRLLAMTGTVPASYFQLPPNASGTIGAVHSLRHSYLITSQPADTGGWWPSVQFGSLIQGPGGPNAGLYPQGAQGVQTYNAGICSYIPGGINGVFMTDSNGAKQNGDWDNGPAFVGDGPLLNKVDEGTDVIISSGVAEAPYVGLFSAGEGSLAQQSTYFSPNRQVSSPVMFGSLPTGVIAGKPWQTLLFHPPRSYFPGGASDPGAVSPPDHLLLDLFWMPVVEPYPISEPFATGGKININYQIAPFNYITRKTGLYAVLQSAKMTALNPNQNDYRPAESQNWPFSYFYKSMGTYDQGSAGGSGGGVNVSVRRNIDIDDTLREMDYRFGKNQPFISASEITTIPLIPMDQTDPTGHSPYLSGSISNSDTTGPTGSIETKLAAFWNADYIGDHTSQTGNFLTGDNSLERPYSSIYPRLTTKSNTYTVHVRVQTLKKNPFTGAANFINGEDQVTGEFRGSFVVERYLDPTSAGFVDSSGQTSSGGVPYTEASPNVTLGPYRFRVISSKQFAP